MSAGGLTPEENAEWLAAYRAELAGPEPDEGMVLRLAAEKTAHLWGVRIAPDGEVVLNPERMNPDAYVTKISVPDLGDGGVQQLRSHFLQPETEIEAGQ